MTEWFPDCDFAKARFSRVLAFARGSGLSVMRKGAQWLQKRGGNGTVGRRLAHVFPHALPVVLAYLVIGIPCGVLEAQIGFGPLLALAFSSTFYTGAGQFMLPQMVLAGMPLPTTIASIVLVSSRQLLYSAGLAPYLGKGPRLDAFALAATVTDESFGVNLDRFAGDAGWDVRDGLLLNLLCMSAWALANAAGVLVGGMVSLPTALMSFGMTSIFVCLLLGQLRDGSIYVAALVSAPLVLVCKLAGLQGAAVLLGAAGGVVCGLAWQAWGRSGGIRS